MGKLKVMTSLMLLITSPSMLVYPQQIDPVISPQFEYTEDNSTLSYDQMLHLFDAIESGDLEERCTPDQLEQIKRFIALLAKEGAIDDASEESLSLEADIEELLQGHEFYYADALTLLDSGDYEYSIIPAVYHGHEEIILCRGWLGKQWKHVKKFAKKHKKALLIGAGVVVAVGTVVIAIAVASSAATGAAVGAVSAVADQALEHKASTPSNSTLKSTIDSHITEFKENIVQEQLFQPASPDTQNLSWEENGRTLASMFAHDSYHSLQQQLPNHPQLLQEIQEINARYAFPNTSGGHCAIDQKFSTDYTHLYSNTAPAADLKTLSYQARAETAFSSGYYEQAVHDFSQAIANNPSNPTPYLERSASYFNLGQYDRALDDFHQFSEQTAEIHPLSISEFSLGLAKGLPKGIYESGEGMLLFLADFVQHPIHTSEKMVEAFTTLAHLAHNDEWGVIGEALSPEAYQLVTQWDTISSAEKGELAGFALGKSGTDIIAPGALAKVASKSMKAAQELTSVCKNLKLAQEAAILETAAEIGNSAKIAEVVEHSQRTVRLADELGFAAHEVGQLKQAGKLEAAVADTYAHLGLTHQESLKLFEEAGKKLKPYQNQYMPETRIKELIHETGIPTFPRPRGIPENYRIKLSGKGAGIKYVHPSDEGTYIRIMPGTPHSKNPCQKKPYVNHRINGQSVDKFGKKVPNDSPEAHIPFEEFICRDIM